MVKKGEYDKNKTRWRAREIKRCKEIRNGEHGNAKDGDRESIEDRTHKLYYIQGVP